MNIFNEGDIYINPKKLLKVINILDKKKMKKIAILISGQIRIFEKNISFLNDLKNSLSDYEITL